MQELDYITITGFKSIKSLEKFPLYPINIIIGSNGSGKSNFISIFSFLNSIREGKLQSYIAKSGGADDILFFGSKQTKTIEVKLSFEKETNQYSLILENDAKNSLVPTEEYVYFWNKTDNNEPYSESFRPYIENNECGISSYLDSKTGKWLQKRLDKWKLFHVHDSGFDSPLRKSCNINDNRYLQPNGQNLPAFLYLLKTNYKTNYKKIIKIIRLIAPFFKDFHLTPSLLNKDLIFLEWMHQSSDKYLNASHFSDGTLRFIFLTTLLNQPLELLPSVIVIDEPELGLHPSAIAILAEMVKIVSNYTQIIISTQSSLLIDYFSPEDIIISELDQAGSSKFQRLDEENLKEWLDDYSLGQLWEKNVLGGRP
jgi:predicted ATPase